MRRLFDRFQDEAYTLLRVVAGLLFVAHGLQKFGMPGGLGAGDPMMAAAAVIETVGGTLIAAGLFTSPVAFIASGEMAVAYFRAHAPHGFSPLANKGEIAVVYCFLFLFICTRGGGPWSVDRLFGRPKAPLARPKVPMRARG